MMMSETIPSLTSAFCEDWLVLQKNLESIPSFEIFPEKLNAWINDRDLLKKKLPVNEQSGDSSYLRYRIGINNKIDFPYEGLLIHWPEGSKTNVHGHPDFAFYRVLSGSFEMNLYEKEISGKLRHQKKVILLPGDFQYSIGEKGKMDNFIHDIRCIQPGVTFHFYSNDARLGETYS